MIYQLELKIYLYILLKYMFMYVCCLHVLLFVHNRVSIGALAQLGER